MRIAVTQSQSNPLMGRAAAIKPSGEDATSVGIGGEGVGSGAVPLEDAGLELGELSISDRDGEGKGVERAHPARSRTLNSAEARTLGIAYHLLMRAKASRCRRGSTRSCRETGAPLFLLKGGVAMELRVGTRARASRDYDTAFRADLAVRIPVRIGFAGYDWGSVDLEVSAAEGGSGLAEGIEYANPAPALSVFGLPDGERVALLPLEELVAADDLPRLRSACEEVFALRDRTPWPPVVTVYAGWYEPYRTLADTMDFPVRDVAAAAAAVTQFIARIASAPASG
jgi:hypothetical protein